MDKIRKSVLAYVKQLKRDANTAKLSPQASTDEKAALREAAKLLADSVANLMKIVEQHDALLAVSPDLPPEAKARLANLGYFVTGGDADLSSLLYAASTIGNLALYNPVTRRELMQKLTDMKAQRTAAPLRAKLAKVARRDEVIRKYADQVRAEHQ